jgi:hypothetical protein
MRAIPSVLQAHNSWVQSSQLRNNTSQIVYSCKPTSECCRSFKVSTVQKRHQHYPRSYPQHQQRIKPKAIIHRYSLTTLKEISSSLHRFKHRNISLSLIKQHLRSPFFRPPIPPRNTIRRIPLDVRIHCQGKVQERLIKVVDENGILEGSGFRSSECTLESYEDRECKDDDGEHTRGSSKGGLDRGIQAG